ncbi:peptidylprolyl isomerase [Candidatus Finniella inopinata]|uniref:Parvulin-like PPIase n=1 Tax=Candidatus Finniella inopinata TaxID=1696036 RepID=A0A4V2DZW2_9PROT|nr:peptidylprolyl isomerase [Candidatus Finniella inopinata]RZI46447.1 hypothetical protein EQU50_02325 [Candidatus Finniella inopinata]
MHYKILTVFSIFSALTLIGESQAEKRKAPDSQTQETTQPPSKKQKGPTDQDGARIAIIVNKDVITFQDIQDRARLVLMTSGVENTPEMLKTVENQVKKSLIDEKIQLQAAKLQKVFISDAEVEHALKNIAKENNMTLEEMTQMFKDKGVNIQTLKDRLRAQISWARTIREAFGGVVQISDAEIQNKLKQLEDNENKEQFELMEISLSVDSPAKQSAIAQEAAKLHQQLQHGAHFHVMAQQFSESTTSASGGYMGWFAGGQMDPALEPHVVKLKPGEFTSPIRTSMGYKIILLKDMKKPNQAPIGQTQITYKQVLIPYHDNITEEDYQLVETRVAEMKEIKDHKKLEEKAQEYEYQCETSPQMPMKSLPAPLQKLFHQAPVGQCLQPIRTPEHLIVTMVCSKTAPTFKLPTTDDIRNMLEQEKFGKIAAREFNKIHSIAFIEDKT